MHVCIVQGRLIEIFFFSIRQLSDNSWFHILSTFLTALSSNLPGGLCYIFYINFERVPLAAQFVKVHYYFINCSVHIYIITRRNIYEKQRQKAKLLQETEKKVTTSYKAVRS